MPNTDDVKSDEVKNVKPKAGVFETYTVTDGLPAGVWALIQNRNGYLWLGTEAGLCRYDSAEFLTYTTADGLAADSVSAILEDRHGRLWMGTGGLFGVTEAHNSARMNAAGEPLALTPQSLRHDAHSILKGKGLSDWGKLRGKRLGVRRKAQFPPMDRGRSKTLGLSELCTHRMSDSRTSTAAPLRSPRFHF